MQDTLKDKNKPKQEFEDTEHTSEPDSDTVGMLELSDQELETATSNMQRVLMDKVDRIQNIWQCKNRDENSKKE